MKLRQLSLTISPIEKIRRYLWQGKNQEKSYQTGRVDKFERERKLDFFEEYQVVPIRGNVEK